jgi:uncharacterized protein involved in exopolysaccharide biosynthesis
MTPGPVDAYVSRLQRELRQRGLDDQDIVDEAREHLVDAVAAGQQRGLSVGDAEREALERFGAPEIVAAHAVAERDHMLMRFAAVLDTVWRRKWWILAPTVLTAVVTSAVSYYFLPTRYRSEASISIVSQGGPAGDLEAAAGRSRARLQHLSQNILSRTRLERIITDFGLYEVQQQGAPLGELVLQMRRDIEIDLLSDGAPSDDVGGFNVSFVASDPTVAMKITERLASLFVEENLRGRESQVSWTSELVDTALADVRGRIIAHENTLEKLRAQRGTRPLSQADLLPYDVLLERYRALLIKSEEAKVEAQLERRSIGEQYRIVDAARLPERPVGPSRLGVNMAGTLAGLGLGLVFVGVRSRSKKTEGVTGTLRK